MATLTVRALDSNGDPLQGNGQNCFLSDLAAVAQIIGTRLKLFEGEFWENLSDGLPLFQQILGGNGNQRNLQVLVNLISARISGTVYVTSISSVSASFTDSRLAYTATVETAFGTVYVTNTPATSALLPSTT